MKIYSSVLFVASFIATIYSAEYGINDINTPRAVKELGLYIKQRAMVYEDPSEMSVYYNVDNNEKIYDMMPRPWIRPGQSLRLPFVGDRCACTAFQCGCCAGIKISQFNIDRKACANMTYDPSMLAINLDVSLNDHNVLHQSLSARNPPPVCIPVPIAGIPGIDFCIKLFDISTQGTNLHVCVDFETRIASAPVLVLHFDCVTMGSDGVSLQKPGIGDTQTAVIIGESPDNEQEMISLPQSGIDTYDEVTEIIKNSSPNSTSLIENSIEDNI